MVMPGSLSSLGQYADSLAFLITWIGSHIVVGRGRVYDLPSSGSKEMKPYLA